MNAELVQTTTEDNLRLSGLFVEGDKNKPVLIFIHGFEGDFYTHKFISSIGNILKASKLSFLSVQTRGMVLEQELITTDGEGKYYGSHVELIEEAYKDIDAWVKFLKDKGFNNIVLSGHSLGTIKTVRYLFEGYYQSDIQKIILFCPFDKNGQEDVVTEGKWKEYSKIAKQKISEGKGREFIPLDPVWEEVVMSYQTFYSWYKNEDELDKMFDFYNKDYNFPTLNSIDIPVHTIVGTHDEYFHRSNPQNLEEAFNIMLNNLKLGSGKFIEGAKHSFKDHEEEVAEETLKFLKS